MTLPADLIRHIPFNLDETNEKFSMDRLSVKGEHKWPPGLQDDRYRVVKRHYETALDTALEQSIEGRIQTATLENLGEEPPMICYAGLDEVVGPQTDPLYLEARKRLDELKRTVLQLKYEKVQRAIGDIDRYSGTTVNDLKVFMQTHHLRFGSARSPEEITLFQEVYAALVQQKDKLPFSDSKPIK